MNAFQYFAPNTLGISKAWWGKSRDEYNALGSAKLVGAPIDSAVQARQHVVRRIVDDVHAAVDDDQHATALFRALNHHKLRDYAGRIYQTFLSESVQIGLHALNGMQELVRLITEGANPRDCSRDCLAFLQMIALCLTKGIDKNKSITQRSVFRNVFHSLGRQVTRRLMAKAENKQKRMEEESLRDFKVIESDAKRSKYTEEDIIGMRKYLCSHKYARDSPNAKDSIDQRDMYGKSCY